jgi:hypothetical protein
MKITGVNQGCKKSDAWCPSPLLPVSSSSNPTYMHEHCLAVGWSPLLVTRVFFFFFSNGLVHIAAKQVTVTLCALIHAPRERKPTWVTHSDSQVLFSKRVVCWLLYGIQKTYWTNQTLARDRVSSPCFVITLRRISAGFTFSCTRNLMTQRSSALGMTRSDTVVIHRSGAHGQLQGISAMLRPTVHKTV